MKIKRGYSFAIIVLVYLLASVVGIFTYLLLDDGLGTCLALLVADVVATVVTFIFSVIFKNASVYDPYWSVQPLVILCAFVFVNGLNLTSALIFSAICLWAVRLTANWAYTFHGMEHQDWRYTMLKEKTGVFYPVVNLIGIHLVPTVVVYLCTLPAVILVIERPELDIACLAGLALVLTGIALELFADIQMHIYRKNRTTPFIRIGVWKNSRHPNYLGEILVWWGVALYCIANMSNHWILLIGAIANSLLFAFVSIPLAENRQSKKEGYLEYVRETNVLIPLKKAVSPRHKNYFVRKIDNEENK